MTDKIYEAQFMQLIIGIQSSAWMMLGKVMNPLTGKIEKNLEGAKASIDTLIMLKEKTKGNLSKTEENFLANTIQQLQLNYIEESKKSQAREQDTSNKEENQKTKQIKQDKEEETAVKAASQRKGEEKTQ